MDVWWWIETGVFPHTAPRVIAAIDELAASGAGVRWLPYEDGQPPVAPPAGACVVFWGSLGAVYEQRVAARWTPGAIGELERFRCSAYQAQLGEGGGGDARFANAGAVFTTVSELVGDPRAVLGRLGDPARVFVRPDSAAKPFSGRTLEVASLSLAALDYGFYYDDAQLPIAVSAVKQIGREWRFVVADGALVASSEYVASRRGAGAEVPDAAREVADRVARAAWQAAPVYVVDVGEVNAGPALRVMELNPFSGADLYACDAHAVVEAVSRVARRLHARV
jgi:hypothetical protein